MIVVTRLLQDRRRSVAWWAAGLLALVVFTVALYPSVKGQQSFEDLMAGLPDTVKAMVGYDATVSITSPAGYLHARLFSTLLPLVALVFAIGAGAQAIGGAEESGTLEPLLANPVSRSRVLVERYLAVVVLLLALTVVFTAAVLVLGAPFGVLEGVSTTGVLGACLGVFGLALLHATLAFAVGAATGRRGTAVAVATVVAVAGYLAYTLFTMADVPTPLHWLTPWYWLLERNMLAQGVAPAAIVLPVALSVPLLALGWASFLRRDLR